MYRKGLIALAIFALVASAPALAGHGEKCKYGTQDCLNAMAGKMKKSGWVGIEMDKDDHDNLVIVRVVQGSPAEEAGLKPGDVLFALEGVEMDYAKNEVALKEARKEWTPGQSVTYTVKRNGADKDIELTLAPMPADVLAKWVGQHMLDHANVEIAENN